MAAAVPHQQPVHPEVATLRVAVIGAGVAGLVAAHRLSQRGHRCDVYERWPGLGGQAATIDVGGGILVERYYHHLFTTDRAIASLYDELGMPEEIEWLPSSVAVFSEGRSWPFVTAGDLLRFGPVPPLDRLRLGAAVVLGLRRGQAAFEGVTAKAWIERWMGRSAWEKVWGPLLRGKFGARAEDISMVWLWRKLTLRRDLGGDGAREERLGYPRSSWERLFGELARSIEAAGGRVLIDRPAATVDQAPGGGFIVTPGTSGSYRTGHDPRAFPIDPNPEHYDAVLATVPGDVFAGLLTPGLAAAVGGEYLTQVTSVEYHTALCLLLEIDRQFGTYYWTNISEPGLPFIGLIEQGNLVGTERYGGRRFLYVANYLESGDPLLDLDADHLLERYEPGLRRMNPAFDRTWVLSRWRFAEPAAQPIVTVGYGERIPPLQTSVDGLVLANTTQIYPEDRGTNYSVVLGDRAADALLASAAGAPAPLPTV